MEVFTLFVLARLRVYLFIDVRNRSIKAIFKHLFNMKGIKEFKNPIYSRLCEQLLLEYSIHRQRKAGFDFSITLLCDHLFPRDQLIRDLIEAKNLLSDSEVTLANIIHYAVLINLDHRYQTNLFSDSFLKSNILDKIISVRDSQYFPASSKSSVLFLLKDVSALRESCLSLSHVLSAEVKKRVMDGNYTAVPDIIFGCLDNAILSDSDAQLVFNEAGSWTREKLAKMIMYLHTNDKQVFLMPYVEILENIIEDEFNSWIEPDIWLSIIESEKLINSNLPINEVKSLLQNLKGSNVSWSKIIEEIETDGVFIRLNSFQGKSGFSSTEDSLSVLALKNSKRDRVYQIDREEAKLFESMNLTARKLGANGVRRFVLLTIIFTMSVTWLLSRVNVAEFTAMFDQSLSPDSIKELVWLILRKPVIVFLLIVWNFNAWRTLKAKKDFRFRDLLSTIPFVGKSLKSLSNNYQT